MTAPASSLTETEVLRVKNLVVSYPGPSGRTTAVAGVDLELERGRVHALIGASGSGKSTVVGAILRLLSPAASWSGEIYIEGQPLHELGPDELRRARGGTVGWAFQDPGTTLDPIWRIGTQLLEALAFHVQAGRRLSKQDVFERLREVGLPNPEHSAGAFPHELSGGMQQRVGLALALCGDPSILIADEPTSALDTLNQRKILALIQQLARARRLAVLLISHDLGAVAEVADDVSVMQTGRIVERGSRAAVLDAPKSIYARQLVEAQRLAWAAKPEHDLDAHVSSTKPRVTRALDSQPPVALRVEALAVTYQQRSQRWNVAAKTVHALAGVSFELRQGRTLGVIGQSGSGKTTLGRVVLGLVRASSGRAFLHDVPLQTQRGKALKQFRRRVQLIPQDPYATLNPRMTIEDTLVEPLLVHGVGSSFLERRQRAASLLGDVGLEVVHLARYPHELSGGQRQRVAIARALAVDPELVVCDEPVAQLDPIIALQILELLESIQRKRNVSYLFISHDIRVVSRIAHDVIVLHDGQIVERGTTQDVFTRPQCAHTRELLGSHQRSEDHQRTEAPFTLGEES